MKLAPDSKSGAEFADGGRRRCALWRRWVPGPRDLWVCLNPSTAGAEEEDHSTRKIRGFAGRMGAGGYLLMNLFDWCATQPRSLYAPGLALALPDNLGRIAREAVLARFVVCAWGRHGGLRGQAAALLGMLRAAGQGPKLRALRINVDGSPSHPLTLEYAYHRTVPYDGERDRG